MAKFSSSGFTVTLDDSGGVARIITLFLLTIGALKITNMTQKSTAIGDSWEKSLVTGIRAGTPIALTGLLDDTANTGTFATLIPAAGDVVVGFVRNLVVAIGGGHSYTATVILADGAIVPKTGGLAEFAATLQPTGVITIA